MASLIEEPLRFGELRRALPGIAQHRLTEQLDDLARNGIVVRHACAQAPPKVEYALSEARIDLMPTFRAWRGRALGCEGQLDGR